MELFSSDGRQEDPRNHCVPLLDTFVDDCDPKHCFLVMPLLQSFDSPDFESVDEVIEFVRQTLEVNLNRSNTCGPGTLMFVHLGIDLYARTERCSLVSRSIFDLACSVLNLAATLDR